MKQEAFVYCWTNLDNNNKYVGYHKGNQDDGYICSSKSERFWKDWERCEWNRQIVAEGSAFDCRELEYKILKELDLNSTEYYNNSCGKTVLHTPEVRAKMSKSQKGRVSPMKGKVHSEATKLKMSNSNRRSNLGIKLSESTKSKISAAKTGILHTEESKRKMSVTRTGVKKHIVICPHCSIEGGEPAMKRWHFDNCKLK